MMKNKRRGFTVEELVVIIAVVAILAAVLIPTYVHLVKKSNEANAQVEAKNLISEMLTDIILGKEGDADLLVFSEKGSNVYAYAYSRTEGKIISYKEQFSNTTTFEGTVEAAIRKMLSDGAIRDLNVPEDDWRHPANVIKIVDSLSVNGKMIVYANYEVIADVFETHVHNFGAWENGDAENHIRRCSCGETETAKHEWESKTENNVKIDTCKVCHATKTEVISGDKTHHLFHHVAKAATCTEAGNIEYWECVDEGCGKYFSDSEATNEITDRNSVKIAAKGHTYVTDAAVAATCIRSGLTEGKHCSVCHKVTTPQTVTPATGRHTWDAGKVTTPATCTATGIKTFTCIVCKVATKMEAIPKTAHTLVTDPAVAATCSTKGKTEGSHCSVCNAVIKAQEPTNIDPNNHESIKWKHKICLKVPYFDEKNKIFIANESNSSMNYVFGLYDREFTYVQLDWECDACKRKNDSVLKGYITFTDYKDSKGNPVKPDELKCGEIYDVTIKCKSQIISENLENGDKHKIPHCNSEWKVKVYIDHWCVNNAFDDSIGEKCMYCYKIIESAPNTHIIGIETEGYLEDLTAGK